MFADAIMDPEPTVFKSSQKIRTAAHCILEHRFRHVPVVDDDGIYLGVFGVHCLLKLVLPKAATMGKGLNSISFVHENLQHLNARFLEVQDNPLSTCINKNITTVNPDTPLVESLLILYNNKASIPVVEKGSEKLVGMISYFDVGEKILAS